MKNKKLKSTLKIAVIFFIFSCLVLAIICFIFGYPIRALKFIGLMFFNGVIYINLRS